MADIELEPSGDNPLITFVTLAGSCSVNVSPLNFNHPTAIFRLRKGEWRRYYWNDLREIGDRYFKRVQISVTLERGGVRKFELLRPPEDDTLQIKLDGDSPNIVSAANKYPGGIAAIPLRPDSQDDAMLRNYRAYLDSLARGFSTGGFSTSKDPAFYETLEKFKTLEEEYLPFFGELLIENQGVPLSITVSPLGISRPFIVGDLEAKGAIRTSWTALQHVPTIQVTLKSREGDEHTFTMNSWDAISMVTIHSGGRWPPRIEVGMDYKVATGRVFRASNHQMKEAEVVAAVMQWQKADVDDLKRLDAYAKVLEGDRSPETFDRIGFRVKQLEIVNHCRAKSIVILTSVKTQKNILEVDVAAKEHFETDWSTLGAAEGLVEGDPLCLTIGGNGLPAASMHLNFTSRINSINLNTIGSEKPLQSVTLRLNLRGEEDYEELSTYVNLRRVPEVASQNKLTLDRLLARRESMRKESLRPSILLSEVLKEPPPREYTVRIPGGVKYEDLQHPKLYIENGSQGSVSFYIRDARLGRDSPIMTIKRGEVFAASWRDFVGLLGHLQISLNDARLIIRLDNGEAGIFVVHSDLLGRVDSKPRGASFVPDQLWRIDEKDGKPRLTLHSRKPYDENAPRRTSPLESLTLKRHDPPTEGKRRLEKHQAEFYRDKALQAAEQQGAYLDRSFLIPTPMYPSSGVQPQRPVLDHTAIGSVRKTRGVPVEFPEDVVRIRCLNVESPAFAVLDESTPLLWRKAGELLNDTFLHRQNLVNAAGRPKRLKLIIWGSNGISQVYTLRAIRPLSEIIFRTDEGNKNPRVDVAFRAPRPTEEAGFQHLLEDVRSYEERAQLRFWQNADRCDIEMLETLGRGDRLEAHHFDVERLVTQNSSLGGELSRAKSKRSLERRGGIKKKVSPAKSASRTRLRTKLRHVKSETPKGSIQRKVLSKRDTRKEGGAGVWHKPAKNTRGDNDWRAGGSDLLHEVREMHERAAEPPSGPPRKAETRSHSVAGSHFGQTLDTLAGVINGIFPAISGESLRGLLGAKS